MGGLFKAPKPKIIPQPSQTPAMAAQPSYVAPVSAMNTPPPSPAAEAASSDARIENGERATRGLPGTIATSARGLLGNMPDFITTRRSLLGE
ncbi:MAG: hypothetical protein FJX33_17615 [Alphaproteobacteria bacterium]|nr:hypothetical protein [Alphaproteobacteria bacterium]